MRKHLYRGRPKEGALEYFLEEETDEFVKDGWVYGSLIWHDDIPWIVSKVAYWDDNEVGFEWWVPVVLETVGQFSGMTDNRNDIELFEGDYVIVSYSSIDGHDEDVNEGVVNFKFGAFYIGEIPMCSLAEFIDFTCIGNIFDNPELSIKGEEG